MNMLSEPLSEEELDHIDDVLLERVDEEAATDGMDERPQCLRARRVADRSCLRAR